MLVFDSTSFLFSDIGTISRVFFIGIPRVSARFGEGSASMAIVFNPFRAKEQAKAPAIRVLPTPPFPETAIFTRFSPFSLGFPLLIYVS